MENRTCLHCGRVIYGENWKDFGADCVCENCYEYYDFCEPEEDYGDDREPDNDCREATLAEYSRWERG